MMPPYSPALRGLQNDGHGVAPVVTDVLIIGAGFSGIGMAVRLARTGLRDFVLLERATDVGGTWRDNTYPGVACDIPSHLYSYSFLTNPRWSRVFSPGQEILDYLKTCVQEEQILPHIHFRTKALDMRWNDETELWEITTNRGHYRARVLITAVGRLSEPRIPQLRGMGSASGEVFHSSRWRHDASIEGRRVAIVGTGASAVQMVPHLASKASRLVVFQRSAPYLLPRGDRLYDENEKELFQRDPRSITSLRSELFSAAEEGFSARTGLSPELNLLRARALNHLLSQVNDRALAAKLMPNYEIGCKRIIFSDDYYPSLQCENVVLEESALSEISGDTLRAASGHTYKYDVLVLATGYKTFDLPFAENVYGLSGKNLAETWSSGMKSFASTVVHGFPNLFVMDGPNASLGHNSAIYMIETQINYILGALTYQVRNDGSPLNVSSEAQDAYTEQIVKSSQTMVWETGGCTSWYIDPRVRRQTLLWPGTARSFREQNGTFDPRPYRWNLTSQPICLAQSQSAEMPFVS